MLPLAPGRADCATARMNLPGSAQGNRERRLEAQIPDAAPGRLRDPTRIYGRSAR